MNWLKPGKNNQEDRENFVRYWAEFVRTHPDEEWSRQQKVLIDSQIKGAQSNKMSAKQYLKEKGEKIN